MPSDFTIRQAKHEDIERAAELVARLKRLHGEFDSLLTPVDDLEGCTQRYLEGLLSDEQSLVLVVEVGGKVEGVLTAKIVDRLFYKPRIVGQIVDIYTMPEYRRKAVGAELLKRAEKELRARGAEMIFAEFPVKNMIAEGFYEKLGFRGITNIFAKEA